jgi:hypothetical protein
VERLTREQAAIVSAYTGYLIGPVSDMHAYIEKIMGRPVWTHEMASEQLMDQVREAAKDDFIALAPEGAHDPAR